MCRWPALAASLTELAGCLLYGLAGEEPLNHLKVSALTGARDRVARVQCNRHVITDQVLCDVDVAIADRSGEREFPEPHDSREFILTCLLEEELDARQMALRPRLTQ